MDLRTGEVRALDSGCLYDLLEKYPDLYENYLAEPEPNRRKTLEDYFIKYLEREKPELLKSVPRKAGSGYNSRNHANDRTGAETKTKRTTTGSGQRMKNEINAFLSGRQTGIPTPVLGNRCHPHPGPYRQIPSPRRPNRIVRFDKTIRRNRETRSFVSSWQSAETPVKTYGNRPIPIRLSSPTAWRPWRTCRMRSARHRRILPCHRGNRL